MKVLASKPDEGETSAELPLGVQVLSFLCGLLVAFLGAKSSFQDFTHARKLIGLDSFVATPGKFLKVDMRHDSVGSEKESYPDILYEYFVDGKSIWGWRLSYEEEPKPADYWKERLAVYSVGADVTVYYNPAEAKDSIIEKKQDGLVRCLMKFGLGVIFLLAGLLLALLPASSWTGRLFAGK